MRNISRISFSNGSISNKKYLPVYQNHVSNSIKYEEKKNRQPFKDISSPLELFLSWKLWFFFILLLKNPSSLFHISYSSWNLWWFDRVGLYMSVHLLRMFIIVNYSFDNKKSWRRKKMPSSQYSLMLCKSDSDATSEDDLKPFY